ncbi:MAG: hypothetical protein EOO03_13105 [Chitinophagaceae bacterium]|nr:MAG: hypothetical protein EOO03_13105 [Chitinophagaceae bacterium]
MKPLQLFIVCNISFFFLLGKQNFFAVNFYNYKNFSPYTLFGTVKTIAARAGTEDTLTNLALQFNERMGSTSKSFLILFIPVLAVCIAAFFIGKRRYMAEHLVFATHYFSFVLLYYLAFHFIVEVPFWLLSPHNYSSSFDMSTSLINLVLLSAYFVLAARRFYNLSNLHSIIGGLFIAVVFVCCIYAYRMFLFYKIMQSIL